MIQSGHVQLWDGGAVQLNGHFFLAYALWGVLAVVFIDLFHRYLYGESKWASYCKETSDDTELGCFVVIVWLAWPIYLVYYVVVTIFTFLGRIFRAEDPRRKGK
ncbi:MAG: hypothetical protein HRF49_01020 [bacterium]|jgi:nitrate reductase NapE component